MPITLWYLPFLGIMFPAARVAFIGFPLRKQRLNSAGLSILILSLFGISPPFNRYGPFAANRRSQSESRLIRNSAPPESFLLIIRKKNLTKVLQQFIILQNLHANESQYHSLKRFNRAKDARFYLAPQ